MKCMYQPSEKTQKSFHEPQEVSKTGLRNTIIIYVLNPGGKKWGLRIGNQYKI